MAIIIRQVLAQILEVENLVDAAQQVICRNMVLKMERIEQRLLTDCLLPHHPRHPKPLRPSGF